MLGDGGQEARAQHVDLLPRVRRQQRADGGPRRREERRLVDDPHAARALRVILRPDRRHLLAGDPGPGVARIPTGGQPQAELTRAGRVLLLAERGLLEGLVEAYDGDCVKVGTRSIVKTEIPEGKVALLIGGGAGHEPIYHGLVGTNMADGAACGDIFAAPPPDIVLEATSAVNKANGVLYLYGNYAGDVMNFDIGAELSAEEGIEVKTVLITDDVCSSPPDSKEQRRGIAGLVLIVKMVGAASQSVQSLDDLERIAKMAVLQTRSVGVSMSPGSIPATGKPTFEIDEELIGLGMGIHGEPGVSEIPMTTADELTPQMLDLIFKDFADDADVDELKEGEIVKLLKFCELHNSKNVPLFRIPEREHKRGGFHLNVAKMQHQPAQRPPGETMGRISRQVWE